MLKITADRDKRRLLLEGSLSGPWVDTLEECWQNALAAHDPHHIAVDLSEVTFVDLRGKELLASVHRAGAALVATGSMNGALIREIARDVRLEEPRSHSVRSFLWLVAGLIPALTLAAACSSVNARERPKGEDRSAAGARPPVAVSVASVMSGSVTEAVDVVGSLAPKFAADLKSEISGTVSAVYVTEWVPVRAGARLARLNTSESEAAVAAIKAVEAQARVNETRARRERDRAVSLKEYGLITPQAVDDARSAFEAAEAAVAAAAAQVRAAEARLAKSFINAPMDGVIALRSVNVGDRVENMGGGAPMFRIVDNRLLDLTVSVPSPRIGSIRVGQLLEFSVDAIPSRTFTGTVMFINPSVDEASRAGKVIAEVRNADGVLKGGQFIKGRIITTDKTDVLQVPRTALLHWNVAARTADVFVVRRDSVELRAVRIGSDAGSTIAIEAGLAGGEQVVVRGGFALKPGDRITIARDGV